jgi:hypothetical protein
MIWLLIKEEIGRIWMEVDVAYFEGGYKPVVRLEEPRTIAKSTSGRSVSRRRFEPGTTRINVRCITAWANLRGDDDDDDIDDDREGDEENVQTWTSSRSILSPLEPSQSQRSCKRAARLVMLQLEQSELNSSKHFLVLSKYHDRAIAQAVSRRFLTATARFRAQVTSCGNCGEQSGSGAGFLRVLRFPLPILIPSMLYTHHLSSGAGTIGQLVADVPSGLSLTPPQ